MKEKRRSVSVLLLFLLVLQIVGTPMVEITESLAKESKDQNNAATEEAGVGVRDVLLSDGHTRKEKDYNRNCFTIGDHGLLSFVSIVSDDSGQTTVLPALKKKSGKDPFKNFKIKYKNTNPGVIKISKKNHTYRAVSGGSATVTITMQYKIVQDSGDAASGGTVVAEYKSKAKYTFIVGDDTSGVKFDSTTVNIYRLNDLEQFGATVKLKKCPEMKYYNMSCQSSNSAMDVVVGMSDPCGQSLNVTATSTGSSTITVTLNNVVLTFKLKVVDAPINISSRVLDKGRSFRLKLKNYIGKPNWQSTDPKVATVDKNGKVKGKKIGNTIIYADINDHRTGCVVSVVKKGISKVVKRARYIGTHLKYSQPLRMKKKYYDCSSLVWKAYRKMGKYICGAKGYAPVAADIGKWCVNTKRSLGYFKDKNIDKLVYLPGDVLLKVHMRSDRYRGIGHIEMITGYSLHGFIDKKPVLYLTWGAREEGYGPDHKDDFVGRPYN